MCPTPVTNRVYVLMVRFSRFPHTARLLGSPNCLPHSGRDFPKKVFKKFRFFLHKPLPDFGQDFHLNTLHASESTRMGVPNARTNTLFLLAQATGENRDRSASHCADTHNLHSTMSEPSEMFSASQKSARLLPQFCENGRHPSSDL